MKEWSIGMEAKKKRRMSFKRAMLAALLVAGCFTCLALILPSNGM